MAVGHSEAEDHHVHLDLEDCRRPLIFLCLDPAGRSHAGRDCEEVSSGDHTLLPRLSILALQVPYCKEEDFCSIASEARAFERTSSPTMRRLRSTAGQSSRCEAKIRSTSCCVHSGIRTFNCEGGTCISSASSTQ